MHKLMKSNFIVKVIYAKMTTAWRNVSKVKDTLCVHNKVGNLLFLVVLNIIETITKGKQY